MQQGSSYRSKENQAWDGVYGRALGDERAAALFARLAEKDASLRTERSALFVQANLTVADAQRRLRRAERFGWALGVGLRLIVLAPFRGAAIVWRFSVAAFGAARSPASVARPKPGALPERFLEDRQLMKLVLQRAVDDRVLREEMVDLTQADISARIEAQQSLERKGA